MILATYVTNDHSSNQETWNSNSVADLLHQRAGRSQRRRSDVGATVSVDHNADSQVDGRNSCLANQHRTDVQPRVSHLGRDGEEGRGARESEDDRCDSRHNFCEGGRAYDFVVGNEGSFLWRFGWTVLDANGDGDGQDCSIMSVSLKEPCWTCQLLFSCDLTRDKNADRTSSGEPANLRQCRDRGEDKCRYGCHCDENGGACTVTRHRIKSDRNAQERGS